jgi:hypothetical protein
MWAGLLDSVLHAGQSAGLSFKRFGEEGAHCIPRAAAGMRVVCKASTGQIDPFKRERMHGMAVAMKLPIGFRFGEFPGDCQHIIGKRIKDCEELS